MFICVCWIVFVFPQVSFYSDLLYLSVKFFFSQSCFPHSFLCFYQWLVRWLSGKESTCNAGDGGWSLYGEESLEEGMVTHSSLLAWRIPWTEAPGGLLSISHKESDRTEAPEHTHTQSLLCWLSCGFLWWFTFLSHSLAVPAHFWSLFCFAIPFQSFVSALSYWCFFRRNCFIEWWYHGRILGHNF